jgi:excisionase family DNA binding protein
MTLRTKASACPSSKTPVSAWAGGRKQAYQIQFYTIAQAAEILRLSPRTVRRLIDAGKIVSHRFGRAIRIAETDLRAFIAVHREG